MTEAEIIRLIRRIIRVELAQTLLGSIEETDDALTTSMIRFETDTPIEDLRLIRPYGFASRPAQGVPVVVHPINSDATHLIALGEYDDEGRPEIEEGEVIFYNSDQGQVVYLNADGDIIVGDYNTDTGQVLPAYRAKFGSDGTHEIKNSEGSITLADDGTITAQNTESSLELDPDGTITAQNSGGTFSIDPSGNMDLDGPQVNVGSGASHGIGLGDNIEQRLTALENGLTALVTNVIAHVHPVVSIGSPTGPETPLASPFTPAVGPAASSTAKVST